jgi:hypothetical protein
MHEVLFNPQRNEGLIPRGREGGRDRREEIKHSKFNLLMFYKLCDR